MLIQKQPLTTPETRLCWANSMPKQQNAMVITPFFQSLKLVVFSTRSSKDCLNLLTNGVTTVFQRDGNQSRRNSAKTLTRSAKMCNLQWRDLEAIGIELAGINQLYTDQWQFPNVAAALAPGGPLFARPHALHCFLGAQPIYVNNNVSNVPYSGLH
jgi:hypothetical protein